MAEARFPWQRGKRNHQQGRQANQPDPGEGPSAEQEQAGTETATTMAAVTLTASYLIALFVGLLLVLLYFFWSGW